MVMVSMAVLVVLGLLVAHFYYSNLNKHVDHRIKTAREMYGQYNTKTQQSDYQDVLLFLDSIESIYTGVEHYRNSYEVGVLHTNRSAVFLTKALQNLQAGNKDSVLTDSLFALAQMHSEKAIDIYDNWKLQYDSLNEEEMYTEIKPGFMDIDSIQYDRDKIIHNRVKELIVAQEEMNRRLSGCYTNYGIIFRHRGELEQAALYYKKAIDLWDRNITAKNNLNIILEQPLEKRSMIEKLFPPPR
jgi:tetratricopeptide (TPR) repeat protein